VKIYEAQIQREDLLHCLKKNTEVTVTLLPTILSVIVSISCDDLFSASTWVKHVLHHISRFI
jgi:hypothetical protein